VVVGTAEEVLGQLRVRACAAQGSAAAGLGGGLAGRTWEVEGAGGLENLLARQLAAAGEHVLDVPPKLAARVRLLGSGATGKNDPNDARSVAVAALRPGACPPVRAGESNGPDIIGKSTAGNGPAFLLLRLRLRRQELPERRKQCANASLIFPQSTI
jgi:hypothetical protein